MNSKLSNMDVTDDVLRLMDGKKRCLRRFLEISEGFLATAESGDLSSLESFELKRDSIIKTLAMFDRKITEVVRGLPKDVRTHALSESVQARLNEESLIVQSILKKDNRIIECLEIEKTRIQRETAITQKTKEITGRFKSGWMPESGEELDQKV